MRRLKPGHEECSHTTIEDPMLCKPDPDIYVRCHHDHKDPVVIGEDLCSPETVGWHCHCCDRVWVDDTYVKGPPQ